jgi:hypothetical protein
VLTGAPLRLCEPGLWDPGEQYSRGPEDTIAAARAGDRRRPRPQFEFEQLLPGGENPDAEDPILEALALRDRGGRARARRLLEGPRGVERALPGRARSPRRACFGDDACAAALAHYATGVRIGERSLPEDFDGVLGWGWIDKRPLLRCLHGSRSAPGAWASTTAPRRSVGRCCG